MRRVAVVAVLLLAPLVAGCPRLDLCVDVVESSATAFTVVLGTGSRCAATPAVTRVTIRRSGGEEAVLWHITSARGTPLRDLHYGALPAGFHEGRPALPLTPGEQVVVTADARGGRAGGATATVTGAARVTPASLH